MTINRFYLNSNVEQNFQTFGAEVTFDPITATFTFPLQILQKCNGQILDYDKLGGRLVEGGATLSHTYRPTDEHEHLPMLYKYHQGNILIRMARLMCIPMGFRTISVFLLV